MIDRTILIAILWWSQKRDKSLTRRILEKHGMDCRELSEARAIHMELRYWVVKLKRVRAQQAKGE